MYRPVKIFGKLWFRMPCSLVEASSLSRKAAQDQKKYVVQECPTYGQSLRTVQSLCLLWTPSYHTIYSINPPPID